MCYCAGGLLSEVGLPVCVTVCNSLFSLCLDFTTVVLLIAFLRVFLIRET